MFLSKMALFVLTHDTVLTSSYVTLTDEEYLRMTAEHNNNNYSEECRGMNKCVFIVKDGKCISNTNDNSSSNVIFV